MVEGELVQWMQESSMDPRARVLCRVRWALSLFILGLVVSGATAIPVETETRWLREWALSADAPGSWGGSLASWMIRVNDALASTNAQYPFMAYGTDWLAFGHFAIAILFLGAWRDPVRNRWLFDYGLLLCLLVIPYALIVGQFRGIPVAWRLIDCSFGIAGCVPLMLCRRWTGEISEQACVHSPR